MFFKVYKLLYLKPTENSAKGCLYYTGVYTSKCMPYHNAKKKSDQL